MDISWHGSRTGAVSLAIAEELQPGLDVRIGRIQLGRSLIGIQCIINLVVTALIQSAEVVPNLGDERVQPDGPAVGI